MKFLFFNAPVLFRKPAQPAHQQLFETFFRIYHHHPQLFPWVLPSPLSKRGLLFTGFRSDTFRKYSGLEIGLLTGSYFGYVRLPGALPGGEGFVNTGIHHLAFTYLQGYKKHFLTIRKSADTHLHLIDSDSRKSAKGLHHFTSFNFYDYSLFVEEICYCLHHYLTEKKKMNTPFQYPADVEQVVRLAEE